MQVFTLFEPGKGSKQQHTEKTTTKIKTKPNDRRSQLPPKTGQGGSSSCIRMRTTHNNKIVMKFYVGTPYQFSGLHRDGARHIAMVLVGIQHAQIRPRCQHSLFLATDYSQWLLYT